MLDMCMALWNLCLKRKVTKGLVVLLLICLSTSLLLVAVGLPVFSQRAAPVRSRSMVVTHRAGRMTIPRTQISKPVQHTSVPTATVADKQPFPCVPMPSEKARQPTVTMQTGAVTGARASIYPSRAAPEATLVPGNKLARGKKTPVIRSVGKPLPDPLVTVTVQVLPVAHPTAVAMPTIVPQSPGTPVSVVTVTPTTTPQATSVANSASVADATPTVQIPTPQAVPGPINQAQDSSMTTSAPAAIFVAISQLVHVAQMAFEQQHKRWPDGCLSDSVSQVLPGDRIVTLGPLLSIISGVALACTVLFCVYVLRQRRS